MKISGFFSRKRKFFSFEFFPPKTPGDTRQLYSAIQELIPLKPAFVSVTSSSTGIASYRTVALSGLIKHKTTLETMAHLTCISHTKNEITTIASKLAGMGVENILALRGDIPAMQSHHLRIRKEYSHASDLVSHLKQLGNFCIGAAGYPEKHPESVSLGDDISKLKVKVDSGAEFILTQLFFDNKSYFRFAEKCRERGINVPIIPGLMPITGYKQLRRFTSQCGVSIPKKLLNSLEKMKDSPEVIVEFGIEWALKQCMELLEYGAPGIHFYTLNRSNATRKILTRLRGSYPA